MDKARERLQQENIKVTPQRLCVYMTLLDHPGHLSVDEIYTRVRTGMPAISLATVYSILQNLCAHGLVQELKIDFERSVFESRTEGHHHFLCNHCGAIIDIDIPLCPTLQQRVINGHHIETFHGYFYGICSTCAAAGKE